MPILDHLAGRFRHHADAIFGVRTGPAPLSAMLRSGGAIDATFLLFLCTGHPQAGVIGAFFTNFLCLADRAKPLGTRIWVQIAGAALFVALAALGVLIASQTPLILAAVLAFAIAAGFVHGTSPGIEAVPRFALCCMVVTAYIPLRHADSLAAAAAGTAIAVATVLIDNLVRRGQRGRYAAAMRASAIYPGRRFSLVYGGAAVAAMGAGLLAGEIRPYWVTLTTLLVMQPDRHTNAVRVGQRFIGTLGGVLMAFAVVHALPDQVRPQGLMALVLALPFLWPLGFDRNYGLGVAILSAWVLLLIDTQLPSADLATPLFLARLSDTSLGCAIALAGSFAVAEVQAEATA